MKEELLKLIDELPESEISNLYFMLLNDKEDEQ